MVVVSHSFQTAKISQYSHLPWIYIGPRDASFLYRVLPEGNRRFIARIVEEVSSECRDNFVEYIGFLSTLQKNRLLWYSSRMASKSVNQTSMFHQYIFIKVVEKLGREAGDILLVTDDREFLLNLGRLDLEGVESRKVEESFCEILKVRIGGLIRIVRCAWIWFVSRFFPRSDISRFRVVIHSWIDRRTFSRPPCFYDPYLRDLAGYLKNNGMSAVRMTFINVPFRYFFSLTRFREIICLPAYVSLKELYAVLTTPFSLNLKGDFPLSLRDRDILRLLTEKEEKKEIRTSGYKIFLMAYYAYCRLNRLLANEATVVYPFENQPWEKMLCLGFAGRGKIAYQHSTIPENFLDYRMSRSEPRDIYSKVILTSGKVWSCFLKEYYPDSDIREAGALRFEYLFGKNRDRFPNRKNEVVVALPIDASLSDALLSQIRRCLERGLFSGWSVKIKPHPRSPLSFRMRRIFASFPGCKVVDDNVSSLISKSRVLITSGSTIAYEGIFSGVSTVYFNHEGLSAGSEFFIRDHLVIVYEDDFAQKLEKVLARPFLPAADISRYFSLPDYTVFIDEIMKNRKKEKVLL